MTAQALALLPTELALCSISQEEIVLPLEQALQAIDVLESQEILILGWEGWARDSAGQIGHGGAPQGTGSLEALSVSESAAFCRKTILLDAAEWEANNRGGKDELYFCITIRA